MAISVRNLGSANPAAYMKPTWPIRAMVRPAKTPPLNTNATAIPRYSQRLGSLAGFPSSSGIAQMPYNDAGAAETRGSCAMTRASALANPRATGLLVKYGFTRAMLITG